MIKIICIGKLKEKYLKEAINDYTKRLSKYTKLQIIELQDEKIKEKALQIEAERILKHIKNNDYVVTLEIEGTHLTSNELAKKIETIQINNPNITFVIGGSYGLDNKIKQRSNYKLSFSNLTFPHGLFRLILLEQIYRSFKIINNESYHK